jgi:hypothetical protein
MAGARDLVKSVVDTTSRNALCPLDIQINPARPRKPVRDDDSLAKCCSQLSTTYWP